MPRQAATSILFPYTTLFRSRDIAKVLGATERGEGFLRGNGYVVTWAIGHLVTLAQPHEIRPEWKRWAREHLPLRSEEHTSELQSRLHLVCRLLLEKKKHIS